jgi:hypothetical protein
MCLQITNPSQTATIPYVFYTQKQATSEATNMAVDKQKQKELNASLVEGE